MNKKEVLAELVNIANKFDEVGLFKEADAVTGVSLRVAQYDDFGGDFDGPEPYEDELNTHEMNELDRDRYMEREQDSRVHGYIPYDTFEDARDAADDVDSHIGVVIAYDPQSDSYFAVQDDDWEEFSVAFGGGLKEVDHLAPASEQTVDFETQPDNTFPDQDF